MRQPGVLSNICLILDNDSSASKSVDADVLQVGKSGIPPSGSGEQHCSFAWCTALLPHAFP